jgi:hypothetical protein
VNLELNGDREYDVPSFAAIDGTTVGGVSVNVTTTSANAGHVELTGPINTFAVGGQETEVDNIEFGTQSNVTANVAFDTLSPSKSSYVVGDSLTVDGVPAQITDFTFRDGTVYQNGSARPNTGTPRPPGGSAPSYFTSNVNLWFNVTDVVEQSGDGDAGDGETGSTANRSTPDTITPGGSATITVETNVTTDGGVTIEETLSPTFETVSIRSVTVDGESVTPFPQVSNSSGVVVTLQDLTAGDRVTVTYEVSVDPDAQTGTEYTVDGNVTSGTTSSLPTDTITVEQGSPLSGVSGRYDENANGDISITELGQAASDYASGTLSITELGSVASIYAQS